MVILIPTTSRHCLGSTRSYRCLSGRTVSFTFLPIYHLCYCRRHHCFTVSVKKPSGFTLLPFFRCKKPSIICQRTLPLLRTSPIINRHAQRTHPPLHHHLPISARDGPMKNTGTIFYFIVFLIRCYLLMFHSNIYFCHFFLFITGCFLKGLPTLARVIGRTSQNMLLRQEPRLKLLLMPKNIFFT